MPGFPGLGLSKQLSKSDKFNNNFGELESPTFNAPQLSLGRNNSKKVAPSFVESGLGELPQLGLSSANKTDKTTKDNHYTTTTTNKITKDTQNTTTPLTQNNSSSNKKELSFAEKLLQMQQEEERQQQEMIEKRKERERKLKERREKLEAQRNQNNVSAAGGAGMGLPGL